MTNPTKPYPGNVHSVAVGGKASPLVFGDCLGATITNPSSATDQGLALPESLYLSFFGDALLAANSGTIALLPGQSYKVPASIANTLTVNAASSGHQFSVYVVQPAPQLPVQQAGSFPPNQPTTRRTTLNSYLYQQYNDDDDLAAFVSSYNQMTQDYVDTFNDLNLPIYTHPNISGLLLDWVGNGLYGYARPVLSSGSEFFIGPLDTFAPNELTPNQQEFLINKAPVIANDDIYKRSITWHFLKGDGKVFNVRWLKRRIMRWLFGADGVNFNPDNTYQVSVSFGVNNEVTITLLHSRTAVTGGAIPNLFMPNQDVPNESDVAVTQLTPLPYAREWKEAIQAGLLEMPFQYNYVIVI